MPDVNFTTTLQAEFALFTNADRDAVEASLQQTFPDLSIVALRPGSVILVCRAGLLSYLQLVTDVNLGLLLSVNGYRIASVYSSASMVSVDM